MSTIFTKKYSGVIKRKISEGHLSPSNTPELYIKKDQKITVTSNSRTDLYPSKIFNISQKNQNVEITSNTLGIKLTDKQFNGKFFYNKLFKNPGEQLLHSLDNDYYVENGIVYIDSNDSYVSVGGELIAVIPVLGLEPWNIDNRILIRRLKDRFKITIKNVTMDTLKIELERDSIIEPTIQNNWAIFKDFIININSVHYYVYSHSFEYYKKKEIIYNGITPQLKDRPIGNIIITELNERYSSVEYTTYRSNMYINLDIVSDIFINIDIVDQTVIFKVSQSMQKDFLLAIKKETLTIKEFTQNPYNLTPIFKGIPENYYFVWETSNKYNRYEDVPIGCERVVLDLKRVIERKKDSFSVGNNIIKEDNVERIPPTKVFESEASDSLLASLNEISLMIGV